MKASQLNSTDERFVHLHVQSQYSFGSSVAPLDALLDAAAQAGMQQLAITDLGNLCGVLEFSRKATARGIKPIVGYTARVRAASEGNGASSARF